MSEYALRLENGTDTAQRMRQADSLALTPAGPLGARNGVRPGGGDVAVVEGTMQVDVSPFVGWVQGEAATAQGGYPVALDATKTITLRDGDAEGDRVDTIVARVWDDTYDNTGLTRLQVYAIEGTPGGGAPSIPEATLPLRDVTVGAGISAGTGGLSASAAGADRRRHLTALGGLVSVPTVGDLDALDKYPSLLARVAGDDSLRLWNDDSGTWTVYSPVQEVEDSGWSSLSLENGWEAWNGHGLRIRKRDKLVNITGIVSTPGTGALGDSWSTVCTLPAGMRPDHLIIGPNVSGGTDPVRSRVQTGGNFQLAALNGSTAASQAIGVNMTYLVE